MGRGRAPHARSCPLSAAPRPVHEMRAIEFAQFGPAETASLVEKADPMPRRGEVIVAVYAAPVNFVDSLVVTGAYQFLPELSFTPGRARPVWSARPGRKSNSSMSATACWQWRSRAAMPKKSWSPRTNAIRCRKDCRSFRPPRWASHLTPRGARCATGRACNRAKPCSCSELPALSASLRCNSEGDGRQGDCRDRAQAEVRDGPRAGADAVVDLSAANGATGCAQIGSGQITTDLGARAPDHPGLLPARDRGNHPGAHRLRELHRSDADSAGSSEHEHGFARLQARPVAQRAPRGVKCDAHRGGLNERQSLRQRIALVRGDLTFSA